MVMMKRRLGETLLSIGAVDELQLNAALALQRQWGMLLGRAVVQQRFCSPELVLKALALQTGLPTVDLEKQALDTSLTGLVPRKVAEQHKVVPLHREGARFETLVVAIAAPAPLSALDEVRKVSRKQRVVPVLASDEAIERAIVRLYDGETALELPQKVEATVQGYAKLATPQPGPVLVYGWPPLAGKSMALTLAAEGISARVARVEEVLRCGPNDVVVAPLPAIEELMPSNPKLRGRLVVAVKRPAEDAPRAARIGAKAVLGAPVDPKLLMQAIEECRKNASPVVPPGLVARA